MTDAARSPVGTGQSAVALPRYGGWVLGDDRVPYFSTVASGRPVSWSAEPIVPIYNETRKGPKYLLESQHGFDAGPSLTARGHDRGPV